MSVSIPNIPFGEAAVCIAEERTVAITGLPLGTMWRDVSWQMEYCGEVAHYQAFEDTSVPGDILFVVMFTEEQAATDAMLMCDTDVNGHIMTVSPVKVSMKPVTLDDMKLDLAEKVVCKLCFFWAILNICVSVVDPGGVSPFGCGVVYFKVLLCFFDVNL